MSQSPTRIRMRNKPKCFFCQSILEAEAVTINKGISPYYSLANNHPVNINVLPDEIVLEVRCPRCGAHGDALGDYASYKGTYHHLKPIIIEIRNVIVKSLVHDNTVMNSSMFNPSRRSN